MLIKGYDPVTLGVTHQISENDTALLELGAFFEYIRKPVTVEYIVTQDKGDGVPADESFANDEGLGQPPGMRLLSIRKRQSELGTISKKLLEPGEIIRRRDDEYFPNPCQHQNGQRIIDHRLVIYGHELFAHDSCDRIQSGPRTSG
jgi:hypothetical protein